MNADRFKLEEALFDEVLALPPEARDAHLDRACAGDAAMRRRLARLLGHASRELVCDELDDPTQPLPSTGDLVGAAIGPYSVLERIGEGGFGTVYRAEQRMPVRRSVAIKIIKLGMDTAQVLARFEAERQALALMDHPHIARILDAGATAGGRPFVVMELIDGIAVTRFCDERRMALPERLRLFIDVCRAVQHAHRNGVIHRDLKPSNVLVTLNDGVAAPKIIDFGIAKALRGPLAGGTALTELRQLVGTPEYMSPEQAAGADVDTRSDVYSLGVLLHELLVGATPLSLPDTATTPPSDEILRQVIEATPRRPSTRLGAMGARMDEVARRRDTEPAALRRALRGDLDWIILKAIEKDPARRYQTPLDLALDLDRWLESRPIEARPPDIGYLARKWIRRHRVAAVAGASIALALVGGLSASLVALRQAALAERRQAQALVDAQDRLRDALVAQARAARFGNEMGRRFRALPALASAARIRADESLRDEALACLTLADFEPLRRIVTQSDVSAAGLDAIDRIAETRRRGEIVVVSTRDGRDLARLDAPDQECWMIRFSPDRRWIGAKFHDRPDDAPFVFWDPDRPDPVLTIQGRTPRDSFAFCQVDGRSGVVVGGDGPQLDFLSLPTGRVVRSLTLDHPPFWIVADAAGRRIAASHFDERLVAIWDIAAGARLLTIEVPAPIGAMAWTPDGTRLLGCGRDNNLYVWDASDGSTLATLAGHQGAVADVMVSPDSSIAASFGWDNTTRLWDLRSGTELARPLVNGRVVGLGDLLAIDEAGQTSLWRREPAPEFRRIQTMAARGADIVPHLDAAGRRLVSTGEGSVRLRDARTGELVAVIADGPASFVRIAPDGTSVVAATEHGVLRWALSDANGIVTVGAPERLLHRDGIIDGDIDARGRRLALIGGGRIEVVDLSTLRTIATLPGYPGLDRGCSLDPEGRWLFTGCWRGGPARVWDLVRGEPVATFEGRNVNGAFSPDGTRLIVSTGATSQIVETGTWRVLHVLPRNHTGELAGHVAFDGDGTVAAVTDSRFEIRLVEVATGRTLARLGAPEPTMLRDLALSADGSTLTAATAIGELHVWDIARLRRGLAELGLDWELGGTAR